MVCLCVEDEQTCCKQDSDNEHNPHVPSPACSLCDESTANRSKDGTEENAHAIHGNRLSALRRNKEVGDDASADCQASTAAYPGQEAHANEATKVGREGAAQRESAEEDIADVEDDAAAVDFGEGREEEWPYLFDLSAPVAFFMVI